MDPGGREKGTGFGELVRSENKITLITFGLGPLHKEGLRSFLDVAIFDNFAADIQFFMISFSMV